MAYPKRGSGVGVRAVGKVLVFLRFRVSISRRAGDSDTEAIKTSGGACDTHTASGAADNSAESIQPPSVADASGLQWAA